MSITKSRAVNAVVLSKSSTRAAGRIGVNLAVYRVGAFIADPNDPYPELHKTTLRAFAFADASEFEDVNGQDRVSVVLQEKNGVLEIRRGSVANMGPARPEAIQPKLF